jgi:hypothetical protein
LHDEAPKGVRGSIDETRSLRVAAIGCSFAVSLSPIETYAIKYDKAVGCLTKDRSARRSAIARAN